MVPALGRQLQDLVEVASDPRTDTGCRVPDHQFHVEMIGSFFAFFAGRSLTGGLTWAVRTWREFVQHGQIYSLTVARQPNRAEREAAWHRGLAQGAHRLVNEPEPSRSLAQVVELLARIGEVTGQAPIEIDPVWW